MNKEELIQRAKVLGYKDVQEVTFPANQIIEEHEHTKETINILIQGEMYFLENGIKQVLKLGEIFIIPSGTKHSGSVGPEGCTFIVGFRY